MSLAPLENIEALGICEHCGTIFSINNLPPEAMDAEWKCGKCKGILGNKSMGYKEVNGKWKRVLWVGKKGKWVKKKPSDSFELGDTTVNVFPARFPRFSY